MADPQMVQDILTDARRLVAEDWGTTNLDVPFSGSRGAYCASVAISVASTEWGGTEAAKFRGRSWDVADVARALVLRSAGVAFQHPGEPCDVYEAVYAWNDAQVSRAPVLAAFDAAIALLASGVTAEPVMA